MTHQPHSGQPIAILRTTRHHTVRFVVNVHQTPWASCPDTQARTSINQSIPAASDTGNQPCHDRTTSAPPNSTPPGKCHLIQVDDRMNRFTLPSSRRRYFAQGSAPPPHPPRPPPHTPRGARLSLMRTAASTMRQPVSTARSPSAYSERTRDDLFVFFFEE